MAGGSGDDDFPPIPVGTETKRRRGRTPIVLAIVIVLLAIVGGGGYWGIGKVRSYFGAPDYSGAGTSEIVKVKVADGDTSTAIAQTLLTDGVIKSAKAFVNAAKADPKAVTIEAGWYRLHKQMSAKSALEALEAKDADGNPANLFVYKVTIPEGTISIDIYTLLSKQTGYSGQRVHHRGQGSGRPRSGQVVVYGQARRPSPDRDRDREGLQIPGDDRGLPVPGDVQLPTG